jgi:hypothetical protein
MLEAALFPRSWPLIFDFFTFVLHFMLNPVTEPDPEPKCITFPVTPSHIVAVPVTQHCVTGTATLCISQ